MHIDIRSEEVVQILERMTCPNCEALDGCESYQSETQNVLECRYCEYRKIDERYGRWPGSGIGRATI